MAEAKLREDMSSPDAASARTLLDAAAPVPARAARAHAMKNCVAVIAAISRLIERELTGQSLERLERLHAAALRIQEHLCEDLTERDVALGSCELARPLSVASLVEQIFLRLKDRADHAGVGFTTECGGGEIVGTEGALVEAVANLVANAIEATRPGGYVSLAARLTTDDDHVWTVQDTGCGMCAEQLCLLGRPFHSEREGGSGVGLFFARRVIADHGGLMRIESKVGAGTVISVWLPRNVMECR
jgi:signal transduction histidine kinase